MSTANLTTAMAIGAVQWERAPRYNNGFVNRPITCADGFTISVQASSRHYANDSDPERDAPYWRTGIRDAAPTYPFTTFELGYPSGDVPELAEWDSLGVWAWVPRQVVADLLDTHGGAVSWAVKS